MPQWERRWAKVLKLFLVRWVETPFDPSLAWKVREWGLPWILGVSSNVDEGGTRVKKNGAGRVGRGRSLRRVNEDGGCGGRMRTVDEEGRRKEEGSGAAFGSWEE